MMRLSERSLAAGITALLLIPCFWQEHIEAGDLSSHVYNAWLATQIRNGAAPGLAIRHVWTNILADVGLERLMGVLGPAGAERAVVSVAVLIFFWGVFAAVSAATDKWPWPLTPCIGMITYGLIFHFGFLNFYLSVGLCSWAIALLWRPSKGRSLIAAGVAVLAILAHPLPVAWAGAVLVYLNIHRRLTPHQAKWMLPIAAVGVVFFSVLLRYEFPSGSSLEKIANVGPLGITGVEQVWLFGLRYGYLSAGLLVLWILMLLRRLHQGPILGDPLTHVWLLNTLAIALSPLMIKLPQYQHVLAYVPQRMSLLVMVLFFMIVGGTARGPVITIGSTLLALVFFAFLYLDDRALNTLENKISGLVRTLPDGRVVVAPIRDPDTRLNGAMHLVDRACVGHCFSYGNYEPATAQFRIRIVGPTRVAASNMKVIEEIEDGIHTVTPAEAPLYSICRSNDEGSELYLRALQAGDHVCTVEMRLR